MVICRAAVPDKEREASAELADDFGMDEQMSPLAGRQNIEFTNRQLVSLILPMLAEQLLGITVGLADSLMVATVGDASISAVSLVDSVSALMIYIFSAMATGGAVVAGQYLGRREREEACRSAQQLMVLLGVVILIISYIQSYFPPERTKKILGRFHGVGANCIAALLGTVTPFCSCSSIPLFIGFTSAGLPLGVTFSFLISSPMVDLGSLVLLMSIFGWKVAVLYVVLGLVIAVVGGTLIEKLHLENYVEGFIRNANTLDVPQEELHFKDRIKYAWEQVLATAKKVAPYVLIGVGIGAFIHDWIPEDFIVKVLGTGNPFGVILATIAGVPMYADIFGTIPIAEALLAKGAQLGVVLSFMMGVTTLSLPSVIMLRKAVKPKLLGIFIAICTVGIIIVGYFFNAIQYLIV